MTTPLTFRPLYTLGYYQTPMPPPSLSSATPTTPILQPNANAAHNHTDSPHCTHSYTTPLSTLALTELLRIEPSHTPRSATLDRSTTTHTRPSISTASPPASTHRDITPRTPN